MEELLLRPRPGTSQWQGGDGFMFNATRHGTTLDRVTIFIVPMTSSTSTAAEAWCSPWTVTRFVFTNRHWTPIDAARSCRGRQGNFSDAGYGRVIGRATIVKIGNDAVLLNQSAVAFGNAIVEWPDHECAGMACAELRLARQLPTHPNPVWSGHPARLRRHAIGNWCGNRL